MPDSPFLGNTEASLFQSYTGQNPEMGNLLTLSPVFYNVLLFFFLFKEMCTYCEIGAGERVITAFTLLS